MSLSQSTFLVTALLAGFVLWLAAKNRLSAYTAVLYGNTAAPTPSGGSSGGSGGGSSTGDAIKKTATKVAEQAALAALGL